MLEFTPRGHLVPNRNIRCTLDEFRECFVDQITDSTVRLEIFERYIRYSNNLKQLCGGAELIQWIDGSYVTKVKEPGDIDFVSFIDHEIILQIGDQGLVNFKYPESINVYGVDAYIVPIYPESHTKSSLYAGNRLIGWIGLIKLEEIAQEISFLRVF